MRVSPSLLLLLLPPLLQNTAQGVPEPKITWRRVSQMHAMPATSTLAYTDAADGDSDGGDSDADNSYDEASETLITSNTTTSSTLHEQRRRSHDERARRSQVALLTLDAVDNRRRRRSPTATNKGECTSSSGSNQSAGCTSSCNIHTHPHNGRITLNCRRRCAQVSAQCRHCGRE